MTLQDKRAPAKHVDGPLFSCADVSGSRRAQSWLAEQLRRGEHETFSTVIELTPALAELLLARNPDNRNVREQRVIDYATDIKGGNWDLNGEALKVSRCGFLNDGQHRCHGVVRAATSIRTMIIFGLRRETRTTLDQGSVRTAGDYLGMEGIESGNQSAAVAGMLWQYENLGRVSRQSLYRPTKAQVRESFHAHAGINASIRAANHKGAALVGGVSTLAFCHYLFAQKDQKAADEFVIKLARGDGLAASSPVYRCRERLHVNRRMKLEEKVELIFRTWNAVRKNRKFDSKSSPIKGELPALED